MSKKIFKNNVFVGCISICIILIFVYLNIFVNRLNIKNVDLTKEKIYSLSENTEDIVKDINKPININIFGFQNDKTTIELIKKYNYINNNIVVTEINIVTRPDVSSKYELTNGDNAIIISSEDRETIIEESDLYEMDFSTFEIFNLVEQKITNTIVEITAEKIPTIYLLSGHNEYYNEQDKFIKAIENQINIVKILDLSVENVPNDCDVIIISTPETDFKNEEVDKVIEYINSGGKILFLNDNVEGIEYPNMQKILNMFGVSFAKGIVIEQNKDNVYFENPRFIIPKLDALNDICKKIIDSNGKIILVNSGMLNIVNEEKQKELDIIVSEFIKSSDKAFLKENVEDINIEKNGTEKEGPFVLGVKIDKNTIENEKNATLIVIANNMFVTNTEIMIGNNTQNIVHLYNNLDLVINIISKLTNQEDIIEIKKNTGAVTYLPTKTENEVVMMIITWIPILIIVLGIIINKIRNKE